MSYAKDKGTRWETACTRWLRTTLEDERIERGPLHGSNDIGDILGVYYALHQIVIECKATKKPHYTQFLRELENEIGNMDAHTGWVLWKRPGVGIFDPAVHVAMTTKDGWSYTMEHLHDQAFRARCEKRVEIQNRSGAHLIPMWLLADILNQNL